MKLNPHLPLRLALMPTAMMTLLVACGGTVNRASMPEAAAPTEVAGPIEVRIKMTEFVIESSLTTFQTGVPYRFVMESAGALAHDFRITPRGESQSMIGMQDDGHAHEHGTELMIVKEPDLQPGATFTRDITFNQPGEYEFACHVAGHLEAGMLIPIEVTGAVVSVPTPIAPESISYDPALMPGVPCHVMGLIIAGDCTPEEVESKKAEILAKDAATLARLGGGVPDSSMPAGGMMGGMASMETMTKDGMMSPDMAAMMTGRIIIDRVTRRDEPCQIVHDRTILGACSVEDIGRLAGEMMARIDAEAAAVAPVEGDDHHEEGADTDDHAHEPEVTPTTGG